MIWLLPYFRSPFRSPPRASIWRAGPSQSHASTFASSGPRTPPCRQGRRPSSCRERGGQTLPYTGLALGHRPSSEFGWSDLPCERGRPPKPCPRAIRLVVRPARCRVEHRQTPSRVLGIFLGLPGARTWEALGNSGIPGARTQNARDVFTPVNL